jgi:hypothetical protein
VKGEKIRFCGPQLARRVFGGNFLQNIEEQKFTGKNNDNI